MHKAFPAMRGHKLLDKSEFRTKRTLTSLPIYPTERCPIHKAKLLDIFCENHDEVLCATCVAINHRSCQAIHSIPEEVDTLYKQPLSNKIISGLNEEKQQFADIKQRKQHLITEIKKQKKIAIDSILDYKKELEDELNRLERESVKLVEKEYGSIEQDLQNAIKESDKCIDEFEQSADKIQRSQGNKAQEFVKIKTAQRIIRTACESKKLLNKSAVTEIACTMDANIKQFLKQAEVLGHISIEEPSSIEVPRTTAYTVKQHSSFSAQVKSDDSCWLYHSCLLEDGSLLVTDVNNKKLKRINTTNYTITDHFDMEVGLIAIIFTIYSSNSFGLASGIFCPCKSVRVGEMYIGAFSLGEISACEYWDKLVSL
ncbi:uncharacterized protein LOC132713942 [Ruditapes philippinarum]|uniref:uncharacterized protein LOC132713942 n=1 Tax=Ruditapes philippinarum TaxID=129788 RepID=UPI00295ABEA6|nr:uncharacterized protein LOC132713942 [Ruditapes philippinarum]